jgi:branched-chain amino acid transport system ATP-binding protein
MTEVVLETRGLSVSYGGVRALSGLDLKVERGQLVGLIGPNGAGKTTAIDAITGFTRSTGTVSLLGDDITALAAEKRVRRGLARTWQSTELFDELTVRENLAVTANRPSILQSAGELLLARWRDDSSLDRTLELLELDQFADERPEALTQGQRKLVGVARALAADPALVLLDEPAAGLDTMESEALGQRLREVIGTGRSILLVDHDMGLVLTFCDFVYVLDFGETIAAGTAAEVREHPKVIEAYLGSAASQVT